MYAGTTKTTKTSPSRCIVLEEGEYLISFTDCSRPRTSEIACPPLRSLSQQTRVACFKLLRDFIESIGALNGFAVIMFDEVALEKRPRYGNTTDMFAGLCSMY